MHKFRTSFPLWQSGMQQYISTPREVFNHHLRRTPGAARTDGRWEKEKPPVFWREHANPSNILSLMVLSLCHRFLHFLRERRGGTAAAGVELHCAINRYNKCMCRHIYLTVFYLLVTEASSTSECRTGCFLRS